MGTQLTFIMDGWSVAVIILIYYTKYIFLNHNIDRVVIVTYLYE